MSSDPGQPWRTGLEAMHAIARCHATSKQTGQRCGQAVVPGRLTCHWHGGRASAPRDNTNGLIHGDRMREVVIAEKMRAGTSRVLRAMIKGTQQAVAKNLPAAVARTQHRELMEAVAACEDAALRAATEKAERLSRHAKRQKTKARKRNANRLLEDARGRVAMAEQSAKRMRSIAGL
jgi:hypothetical protein